MPKPVDEFFLASVLVAQKIRMEFNDKKRTMNGGF
jgi:hypothetical protein